MVFCQFSSISGLLSLTHKRRAEDALRWVSATAIQKNRDAWALKEIRRVTPPPPPGRYDYYISKRIAAVARAETVIFHPFQKEIVRVALTAAGYPTLSPTNLQRWRPPPLPRCAPDLLALGARRTERPIDDRTLRINNKPLRIRKRGMYWSTGAEGKRLVRSGRRLSMVYRGGDADPARVVVTMEGVSSAWHHDFCVLSIARSACIVLLN